MLRLTPFAALLVAACGGTSSKPAPVAPVANVAPPTRYVMHSLKLHGGEGRHSASQSWTTTKGELEIAGTRVTLHLDFVTDVAVIHCPPAGEKYIGGRQACSSRDVKPTTRKRTRTLVGEARWENGTLVTEVRDKHDQLGLACTDRSIGYVCELTGQHRFFTPLGENPDRLVFAPHRPVVYELEPATTPAGNPLTGTIRFEADATAMLTLAIPSRTLELRTLVTRGKRGFSLVDSLPNWRLILNCEDHDTEVACYTEADRGFLGETEHLIANLVFKRR